MASARWTARRAGRRWRRAAEAGLLLLLLAVLGAQVVLPLARGLGGERGSIASANADAPARPVATSPAPATRAVPAAVAAAAAASTRPAGIHTLEADTAFLRGRGSGEDTGAGVPIVDVLDAGTPVTLIEYGREMSLVRTAGGARGRVPTARLVPPPRAPAVEPQAEQEWAPLAPLDPREALGLADAPLPPADPRQPPVDPAAVRHAITRGVDYLLELRDQTGGWAPDNAIDPARLLANPVYRGAVTALAALTLLETEDGPHDPAVRNALSFLDKLPLRGTYALSLRAQTWPLRAGEPRAVEGGVAEDATILMLSASRRQDESLDFHGYWYDTDQHATMPAGHYDRSNSQFAVQGVLAWQNAGKELPLVYWSRQQGVWERAQNPDGGWGYPGKGVSTRAMTAAGAATLVAIQTAAASADAPACDGNPPNPHLDASLAWLDANLGNYPATRDYYLIHEVSRVGRLTGRKRFGGADWFNLGAAWLVKNQNPDGSWGGPIRDTATRARRIAHTCFALRFLLRGRAAPVVAKLRYPGAWNQRPREVAAFAEWMGRDRTGGAGLTWQTVDLAKDPAEDLFDAPVLYVSGSDAPQLNDADVAKLRAYVEGGGMILGNADCGEKAFAKGFEALGRRMFPRYEFSRLLVDHPLRAKGRLPDGWLWRTWKPVGLHGMSNGVRELMLLVPEDDLGRYWARGDDYGYRAGSNIISHVVGDAGPARHRGRIHRVEPGPVPATATIAVARLMVGANPDPEPGGWRRLSAVMHNALAVDVAAEPVELGAGRLAGFKVAHLTGTTAFTLSPAEREELRLFVTEGGGTLVVEAAGSAEAFADAAEAELAALFGPDAAGAAAQLPPEHQLYKRQGLGIGRAEYRAGSPAVPRVRGIVVNGKTAVFFSRDDLSAGLVGRDVKGVRGYAPATATAIMRNVLLYATGR